MTINNENRFLSINQVQGQYLEGIGKTTSKKSAPIGNNSFSAILDQLQSQQTSEVKFSKHATNRLNDRNIELTESQKVRLNQGMKQAQEKGINDSLIMVDELAFIVNVPNNTVVTAMDSTDSDSNVFTNIDGAVIA